MGPAFVVLCGLILLFAIGVFIKSALNDRRMRKEMLAFIDEIDAKLSRIEQREQLGERYLRIREKLDRYRTNK